MTSKFEILFLIRKCFFPTIFGIIFIYFLHKGILHADTNALIWAMVFLILGLLTLLFSFSLLYKIIIEETGITKVFIMNGKGEFIPFTTIKSSRLEFINGSETDAGQITSGFYICVFSLTNGNDFVLTPEHYENYNQLIRQISKNRSEQN